MKIFTNRGWSEYKLKQSNERLDLIEEYNSELKRKSEKIRELNEIIETNEKCIEKLSLAIRTLNLEKQEEVNLRVKLSENNKDNTNRLEHDKKVLETRVNALKTKVRELRGTKGGLTKQNNALKLENEELKIRIENQAHVIVRNKIRPTIKEYDQRLKFRKNKGE